jgi:uncharacterized protein YoxC
MDSLLIFAKEASPIAILAVAVGGLVFTIYSLLKGRTVDKISDVQDKKYPQIEKMLSAMQELSRQNETLLENHFKHEIPEMRDDLKSIKNTVNRMELNFEKRITRIETKME